MMKKEYIKPNSRVITIQPPRLLLQNSQNSIQWELRDTRDRFEAGFTEDDVEEGN